MFCSKCGKELKKGVKFCTKCGSNILHIDNKFEYDKSEDSKLQDDLIEENIKSKKSKIENKNQSSDNVQNCNDLNKTNVESKENKNFNYQNVIIGTLVVMCVALVGTIIYGIFFSENNKYLSFLSINKKNQEVQATYDNQTQTKNDSSSDSKSLNNTQSKEATQDANLGITSGNLINCCFALENSGMIYYSNFSKQFRLYKMTSDGLNLIQLNNDDSGYLTSNGNYIYYRNDADGGKIYSIKNDGSLKGKVSDDKVSYLQFADGFIYYKNENDNGKVYRIAPNGTSREQTTDSCDLYNVSSHYIYYLKDGNLKKKNLKTKEENLIGYSISKMIVENNKVYYTDNGKNQLYKMDTNGNNKMQICSDEIPIFNIVGDYIFYRNNSDDSKLYKISIDGNGKKKVSNTPVALINSVGDYLYCNATDKTMFKVKKDGTGQEAILK